MLRNLIWIEAIVHIGEGCANNIVSGHWCGEIFWEGTYFKWAHKEVMILNPCSTEILTVRIALFHLRIWWGLLDLEKGKGAKVELGMPDHHTRNFQLEVNAFFGLCWKALKV